MIEHFLSLYNPSFALAFLCLITAATGAFLGANQVRIERRLYELIRETSALGKNHWARMEGLSSENQRVLNITQSHTKLIHDLTPKKKKK